MANGLEIAVKITPTLDDKVVKDAINNIEKLLKGIEAGTPIDTKLLEKNLKELSKNLNLSANDAKAMGDALNNAVKASGGISKIADEAETIADSTDKAAVSAKALGDEFKKAFTEAANKLQQSREELAGLIFEQEKLKKSGGDASSINAIVEATRKRVLEEEKVVDNLRNIADESQKAAKGASVFQKAFEFNQINQALSTVTGAFSQYISSYLEFDKQVQNVATLGVKNLEDVKAAALAIAVDVPDSVATVTEGIYNAISAGAVTVKDGILDIGQATEFVGIAAKLAVGGLTDTNAAIKGLAAVTNAYGQGNLDAARAADILFATVGVGVTTIPELNASLANVVPTAAAFGVSFEQVGGALATLTKQGTATSEATTKLRALLTELAKPGAQLAKVMQQAGVSLESLGREGLQVTVAKLGDTINDLGLNAAGVFSSVEAVGAALALSGKNAAAAQADFIAISTGIGATDKAFAEASKGIAVNVQSIFNTIEAQFFTLFDTLGKGFVGGLAFLEQAAPQFQALAGIKTLLPSFAQINTAFQAIRVSAVSMWASITLPIAAALVGFAAVSAALVVFFTQTETGQKLFAQLKEAAVASLEAIKSILSSVGDAFAALLSGDFSGVGKALENAFSKAGDAFEKSVNVQKLQNSIAKAFEITPKVNEIQNIDKVVGQLKTAQQKLNDAIASGAPESVITNLRAEVEGYSQALAKAVPSAVTGTKTIADAQGNLRTVYEVSTDTVTKFTKAQKDSLDKNLIDLRKDFLAGLKSEEAQYRANLEAVKNLENQIATQASQGKDVTKLVAEYEKLKNTTNESAISLQKYIEEGRKSGLIGNNVKEIAKQFGISEAEAAKLLKTTKEIEAATLQAGVNAGELGTQFKKAFEASKNALSASRDELAGLLAEQIKLRKEGTNPARLKQVEAEIKAIRERIKQEKNSAKELQNIDKLASDAVDLSEKKTTSEKSAFEVAKKKFDTEKKSLEQSLKNADIAAETDRINADRTKTTQDEIDAITRRTEALRKELELAQKLSVSARNADEKAQVQDIINGLNNEIRQQENNLRTIQLRTKIDERQAANELAKLQLEEQVVAFKLGKINETELLASVKQVQDRIGVLSAELQLTQDPKAREALVKEIASLQKDANSVLANLEAQRLEQVRTLNKQEVEEFKSKNDAIIQENKRRLATEKAFLTQLQKGLSNAIRNGASEEIKAREEADKRTLDSINTAAKERIDAIKANQAAGIIDEVAAAEAIAKIEAETAAERVRIENERSLAVQNIRSQEETQNAALRGIALQAEREFRVAELEILREQLNAKLLLLEDNFRQEEALLLEQSAAAESRGDTGLAARLQQDAIKLRQGFQAQRLVIGEEITLIGEEITAKTDILQLAFDELGTTLETAIGDAFSGDWEGVKQGFKNLFGVLAGAISKLASAAILQLLFSPQSVAQLSAGGFLGAAALFGVAKAALTGLINALLAPVLSSLTSFASGGRIDSPTVALVGDASRLGGANTEWVFRDEQIKAVIGMALQEYSGGLVAEIRALRSELAQQNLTAVLSGNDLLLSVTRTQQQQARRQF